MNIDKNAIQQAIKNQINAQTKEGKRIPPQEDKEIFDLARITDAVVDAIAASQPAPEPNKTTN